ncbi:MAG: hypothetical protein A2X28_06235 [Elusimicrobia bacterium GWA2_56_46]|nr:MAG: hypothetical protein A2X28_06235 [Elusimicrobia bacterium GWA2_56_46]OGR54628.1 MAG: hypothetical protein A2X39_02285 [Elusimicrobia bacterium GWC2_56_31]HBW23888.1 hypothetical protein [Elusimicrobiota bacterium]
MQPKSARPFPIGKGRLGFERLLRCSSLTGLRACSFVAPRIHLKSKPPTRTLITQGSIEHNPAALSAISKLRTYPYKTEPNNQLRAEEAAILKKAILADSREDVVKQVSLFLQARQSRRERMRMEFPKLYGDREVTREKWREWVEGLARYTEVKISDELATPSYKSLPEFTALQNSADNTFEREMKKLDEISLNSGEESDYALGWAQWYILDKLRPAWRNEVFGENAFPEDLLKKSI